MNYSTSTEATRGRATVPFFVRADGVLQCRPGDGGVQRSQEGSMGALTGAGVMVVRR